LFVSWMPDASLDSSHFSYISFITILAVLRQASNYHGTEA
jgi:hypothetical protein